MFDGPIDIEKNQSVCFQTPGGCENRDYDETEFINMINVGKSVADQRADQS